MKKENCEFCASSLFCDHKDNLDKRTSASIRPHRLKRKRCSKEFCPLEMED